MDKISEDNYANILNNWNKEENKTFKQIAKSIGCTVSTLERLIAQKTFPTGEMMKQTGIMIELGYKNYSKLSKAQKEKISETLGTVSGGGVGFASITAVISSLGSTIGLSGAGIASGLAALGGTVGGGMAAGIVVAAAIPVAGLAAGFGIIKGVKYLTSEYKVSRTEIDKKWEILK
jgi:hypothetical protein